MFRIFQRNGKGELLELSLKQREQLISYRRERYERDFPALPPVRLERQRAVPTPIDIPPPDTSPTPCNTPRAPR